MRPTYWLPYFSGHFFHRPVPSGPGATRFCHNVLRPTEDFIVSQESMMSLLCQKGFLFLKAGLLPAATASFKLALKENPSDHVALKGLATVMVSSGDLYSAIRCLKAAVKRNPDDFRLFLQLGEIYYLLGDEGNAGRSFSVAAKLNPEDSGACFLSHALNGKSLSSAPPGYISGLFDDFAENYDTFMTNKLHYQLPQKMLTLFLEIVPGSSSPAKYKALDVGCGTGLAGEVFKPLTGKLTGVDLSAKMLAKASEKNCYHTLIHSGVCSFLKKNRTGFNLIIAADVLNYTGDLTGIFTLICERMTQDALLIFSVEKRDTGSYRLMKSGRFTHSEDYIHTQIRQRGLKLLTTESTTIRTERSSPVEGLLAVCRRE